MNNKYNEQTIYYDIALKAREIAEKMGHPMIKNTYYTDYSVGKRYRYKHNHLVISYYNHEESDDIFISVGDKLQLQCNFTKKEIIYIPGPWKELVEEIYIQTQKVLEQRRIKEETRKRKIEDLKALEEYISFYIECEEENKDVFSIIGNKLATNNIYIFKRAYRSRINEDEYDTRVVIKYIYTITYKGEPVAEFMGNKSAPFFSYEYHANKYTSGEWTTIFKNIINETKTEQKNINNRVNVKRLKKNQ